MDQQYTGEGGLSIRQFNWGAAALACVTAFLAVQAYVFGSSKSCVTHFDFNLMFSWAEVWLYFDWLFWVPIGIMYGLLVGRRVPRKSLLPYLILVVLLVFVPAGVLAATFYTTAYTTNPYACVP